MGFRLSSGYALTIGVAAQRCCSWRYPRRISASGGIGRCILRQLGRDEPDRSDQRSEQARSPCCFGRVLPLTEEAMSRTPIILVLIILLFCFDSTGQLETGRKHSRS